ncbi:Dynamin-binding protein [Trichoplax sp. H2]|nr:Dynamin-binding protein [Trichoplax sp. H2]|eukprot:RDD44702.1 Dynamin-binding protein [Trichoplax sp. H2]
MSSLLKAVTEFQGEHEGDLPFKCGDLICILEEVDSNWWKGKLGENIGIFPVSFTREISSQFIATDDFRGDVGGDLPFTRGDVITVTEQIDENWYRGEMDGRHGIFPSSFVAESFQQPTATTDYHDDSYNNNGYTMTPSTPTISKVDNNDDTNVQTKDSSLPHATESTSSPQLKVKKPPISPKPKIDPILLQNKRLNKSYSESRVKKQFAPPVPTPHQQLASTTSVITEGSTSISIQSSATASTLNTESTNKVKRHAPPIPEPRSKSSSVIGLSGTLYEDGKPRTPPPLKPKPKITSSQLLKLDSKVSKSQSFNHGIKQDNQNLSTNLSEDNDTVATNLQTHQDSSPANSRVPTQSSSQNILSKSDHDDHQNVDRKSSESEARANDINTTKEGSDSLASLWQSWESGNIGASKPKKKERVPMIQAERFRSHTIATTSIAEVDPAGKIDIISSGLSMNTTLSASSAARSAFSRSSQASIMGSRNSTVASNQQLETIVDSDNESLQVGKVLEEIPEEISSEKYTEDNAKVSSDSAYFVPSVDNSNMTVAHTTDVKSTSHMKTDNEDHVYESFDMDSGNNDSSDDSFVDAYDFIYNSHEEIKSDSFENIYEDVNIESIMDDSNAEEETECETIDSVLDKISHLEKEYDITNEKYEQLCSICQDGDNSDATAIEVRNTYDQLTDLYNKLGEQHEKLDKLKKEEAELREAKLKKHGKVVDELISTEESFLRDIKILLNEVFEPLKAKSLKEVNYVVLFNNLDDVIEFAEELFAGLKDAQASANIDNNIAHCFIAHAERMGDVYSRYCKNYPDSIGILEKYMEDEDLSKHFDELLDNARQYVNCLSLESLLIKPVQRVLKYPLLVGELIQTLPENEGADKEVLGISLQTIKSVAKKINEKKRQKELVQKYQSGTGIEYGSYSKLPHSIRKKAVRVGMRMIQKTGLVYQTNDGVYNEEVRILKELENYIRRFVRSIKSYLSRMKESSEACNSFCKTISNLYEGDIESSLYKQLIAALKEFSDVLSPENVSYIKKRVIHTLNEILAQFSNPQKLIKKCADKKLDFDNLLPKIEKTKDADKLKTIKAQLETAEADYNALKSHLLEELPRFTSKVVEAVNIAVACYIWSNKQLAKKMKELHEMVLALPSFGGSDQIVNEYVYRATPTIERLSYLSFVPGSFVPTLSRSYLTNTKVANSRKYVRRSQTFS